ncbi:lipase [Xanthomonas campestris pv. phormiicola]|nr:lipase [Xanthomonas campestris pv. phormiicola]UYC14922.1 lipase [Xanthomonas campestris pv. phormiicola]
MSLTSQQYAALVDDGYKEPQETGWDSKVVGIGGLDYRRIEYMDRPSGYQGIIYQRIDNGEIIAVHRGTEFDRQPMHDGIYADGGMVATRHNAQAADAIELTRHAIDMAEREAKRYGHKPQVTVAGHSLGGDLAQVTAHHFGLKGETFNAYGAVSLDRRIPEGGNDVVNHVMAGDPVSAASRHYGHMRVYATPQEIATLEQAGYDNRSSGLDARNPLGAAKGLVMDSHRMHNFLPVDGNGKPDRSVLEDPAARQRAQQYAPMIDKYRSDVETMRTGVTIGARGWQGLVVDGIDVLRGPASPGAGRRAMDAPSWPEQMQHLHESRERGHAPQGWQVPLRVPGDNEVQATKNPAHASLRDDPGAFLDRMLAASQNGDRDLFRQMTQELSNATPGRTLRSEAIDMVNQQEQQAAQQAMQAQRQHVEMQQQETMRIGARSL